MKAQKKEKSQRLLQKEKEMRKAEIKGALTLPKAILQLLAKGENPPPSTAKNALECIEKINKILKAI